MRAFPRIVLHRQSNGKRGDKVDITDVDEQLPAVERKLAESEVRVTVWVCWVEDGGLYETRSRIDEELQRFAEREPDAAAGDAWDGGCHSVSWRAKWDGDVLTERLPG